MSTEMNSDNINNTIVRELATQVANLSVELATQKGLVEDLSRQLAEIQIQQESEAEDEAEKPEFPDHRRPKAKK